MSKLAHKNPYPSDETAVLHDLSNDVRALRSSVSRLEGLVQLMAQPLVLSALATYFRDGKPLRAYELSDGNRSTRDIAALVHVDQKTISTWWRTWAREYNIAKKTGKRGQFKALFTVSDLFIMSYTAAHPASNSLSSD